MKEPFDRETARRHVRAILDGPGRTVFTKRVKKEALENGMTSVDLVNVLRGGKISSAGAAPAGWAYRAETRRMTVGFSFRGPGHGTGAPDELVIETARRNNP